MSKGPCVGLVRDQGQLVQKYRGPLCTGGKGWALVPQGVSLAWLSPQLWILGDVL